MNPLQNMTPQQVAAVLRTNWAHYGFADPSGQHGELQGSSRTGPSVPGSVGAAPGISHLALQNALTGNPLAALASEQAGLSGTPANGLGTGVNMQPNAADNLAATRRNLAKTIRNHRQEPAPANSEFTAPDNRSSGAGQKSSDEITVSPEPSDPSKDPGQTSTTKPRSSKSAYRLWNQGSRMVDDASRWFDTKGSATAGWTQGLANALKMWTGTKLMRDARDLGDVKLNGIELGDLSDEAVGQLYRATLSR